MGISPNRLQISSTAAASSLACKLQSKKKKRKTKRRMDGGGGNWRPTQGADPAAAGGIDLSAPAPAPAGGDWRSQLQSEGRTRIVNKILETLKKHLPVSGPEGLNELQKLAVRFEEKIYTGATSRSDYLRKLSLKMLSLETKTQQSPGNAQVIQNQNPPGSGVTMLPKKHLSGAQKRNKRKRGDQLIGSQKK
nr:mediator of RNA polymerase II transcription subunit 15a isoform X1 [Oryza sativa Japonica Group]